MWWILSGEFLFLGGFIAYTLYRFASRETAWHVFLTVWISWTVALAIIWIVPLDLFYVYRSRCEATGETTACPRVILNDLEGNTQLIDIMWSIVYWCCQAFGWVILTMQQSYIDAGQFTFGGRMWQSLKENLIIIAIGGVLVVSFAIYVSFVHGLDLSSILAILMAITTCGGLICTILLLSYGLIELPRMIWQTATIDKSLSRAEFAVVTSSNSLDDAKVELSSALAEVRAAAAVIRKASKMNRYVAQIISECPHDLNYGFHRREEGDSDTSVDLDPSAYKISKIISIRRRMKRAAIRYKKAKAKYDTAMESAFKLQDIVRARDDRSWVIERSFAPARTGPYKRQKDFVEYLWLIHLKPTCLGVLALLCGLLSLLILVSEVSVMPAIATRAASFWGRSPMAFVVQNFGQDDFSVVVLVALPLSYICVAVYFTLFRMKIFNIYEVVAGETDEVSLLFTGYFITRLVPAICYNFLNLLGESHEKVDTESMITIFEKKYQAMGSVPLVGGNYDFYLPPIILIFCVGTICNVGSRCLRLCNVNRFEFADSVTDDQVADGQVILHDEKRRRLRPDRQAQGSSEPAPNPQYIKKYGIFTRLWMQVSMQGRGGGASGDASDTGVWSRQWETLQEEISQI